MPEFYKGGACKYQKAAQPYLDAIARGIRDDELARAYLVRGTMHEQLYEATTPLWGEQWDRRDPKDEMLCPFWSNYFYEPCASCDCRIEKSVSMEIDAIFFLRNTSGQRLAVHVEMKRNREALSLGQAEAYRPRAACYRDGRRLRSKVLEHEHFVTVLFCGHGTDLAEVGLHFDRVITHSMAQEVFADYPFT